MRRFRPALEPAALVGDVSDLFAVGQLIDGAMSPGNFFVDPALRLAWVPARAETIPWEIFRGRLLPRAQTRQQQTFLAWHVTEEDAAEPTISVKLNVNLRQIYVTRGFLAYVWEGQDAGGGVIESREAIQWTRELVGTIDLSDYRDLNNLRDELICLIWQALVGTSRLPLFSAEAPLPAFTFGQMHYVFQEQATENAASDWRAFLGAGLRSMHAWCEHVKVVEFALRRLEPAEMPRLAEVLRANLPPLTREARFPEMLRALFNNVSLSPWTRLADNALELVDCLVDGGAITLEGRIDFLGHLLRQLGRHLTAYDLVTFHHRGANYPDALLLDAVLKRFCAQIDAHVKLFESDDRRARWRRRALRQGCLLRRHYEGHLVPDLPTSPGENARVMPASNPRVPEEQMSQPLRRRRQLFEDDSLVDWLTVSARHVLAGSIADLANRDERTELGLGVFIDRPLGYGKAAAESDVTPMLAHEAFSVSVARRRWQELVRLGADLGLVVDQATLDPLFVGSDWPTGLPQALLVDCPRPVAALADVRKVAADFVILRTLPGGLKELLKHASLAFLPAGGVRLCLQTLDEAGKPVLAIYDEELRRLLEVELDASAGYVARAGSEWPRAGLRVRQGEPPAR